jgi:hypothetical protein
VGLGPGCAVAYRWLVALRTVEAVVKRGLSTASARLVSAAGVAILVAPLLLGVVADSSDITIAWLLVPAACVGRCC